jgi:hypothetical protein
LSLEFFVINNNICSWIRGEKNQLYYYYVPLIVPLLGFEKHIGVGGQNISLAFKVWMACKGEGTKHPKGKGQHPSQLLSKS